MGNQCGLLPRLPIQSPFPDLRRQADICGRASWRSRMNRVANVRIAEQSTSWSVSRAIRRCWIVKSRAEAVPLKGHAGSLALEYVLEDRPQRRADGAALRSVVVALSSGYGRLPVAVFSGNGSPTWPRRAPTRSGAKLFKRNYHTISKGPGNMHLPGTGDRAQVLAARIVVGDAAYHQMGPWACAVARG
jgi:hypothetical protein